jgi:hypothetical protein
VTGRELPGHALGRVRRLQGQGSGPGAAVGDRLPRRPRHRRVLGRLARESGLARATVQRALDKLFGDCILEPVEDHRGPQPERYRIAPTLVEGEAFGSGMVEGQASASSAVEGPSGLGASPLGESGNFLVDSPSTASGLAQRPTGALVDSLGEASGLLLPSLSRENASQGFNQGSLTSREVHVVGDNDSTAGAVVVADAPPPVPESVKQELERRGLRRPANAPKPRSTSPPTRSREEQLAELRQQYPDDFKSAENGEASA